MYLRLSRVFLLPNPLTHNEAAAEAATMVSSLSSTKSILFFHKREERKALPGQTKERARDKRKVP